MNTEKLLIQYVKYGSVVLAGLSFVAMAISFQDSKKAKLAVKNYNEAIGYLAYKTPVVISNDIVKAAANKAAEDAAKTAMETVREDISKEVRAAVADVRGDIEEEIRKAVAESVERSVDMDELKAAVTTRACSKVVDKIMIGLGKYSEPITNGIMKALAEKGGLR